MKARVPLGRIAGVALALDWSVALIFALVVLNLGMVTLPAWHPPWPPGLVWPIALAAGVLFLASILVHELAHAVVARAFGTPVRSIVLFLFGGVTDIEREPATPRAELLMAIVGPITSLAIGFVASRGAAALAGGSSVTAIARMSPLATVLAWLGAINLVLGVFNLVPGFPLDGGRVVRAIAWRATGSYARATRAAARGGQAVGWIFVAAGVLGFLGAPVPFVGPGVGALWVALIGWFLLSAARSSYADVRAREILGGVPVARLARVPEVTVTPGASVEVLARDYLAKGRDTFVPVVDDAALVGLVDVRAVRRVPPARWPELRARDVMLPASRLPALDPTASCYDALTTMLRLDAAALPVRDLGVPVALISRSDLARWLVLHAQAARGGGRGRRPPEPPETSDSPPPTSG